MLLHPLMEKLSTLKLVGMARALEEQIRNPEIESLSFTDRLGLLIDHESVERENRRMKTRIKAARLREAAAVEDIDYRHPRGLDKALMLKLASCAFVREHLSSSSSDSTSSAMPRSGLGAGAWGSAPAQRHKATPRSFPFLAW